ncbi:hypothetical protein PIROE2DRAFT_9743 [Piromyces sp. E2]|nr:hypothetical protein PIROE2DRAFT_9743 [Piromyces sp. E2]|eukprot:OUM63670.1 hypothetical protein PIROE2DRAFT_9743 [Piromyces sp. E2]
MEYNFFFCEICNRNQIKNKRHIYSKKHRERLNFLLTRQDEKISKLSTFLHNIKIITDDVEQPEIWCLFCKTTIKSSNSKIACHIDSIDEFWREQRPDKEKWKKDQFYLNKAVVNEFLKMSDIKLSNYQKMEEKQLFYSKNIINTNDNIKNEAPDNYKYNIEKLFNKNSCINDNNVNNNNDDDNDNNINNNNINIPYRTIKALSQNLTCININPNQNITNNIYNINSTPPWMLDNSDSESNIIGPSLDLYINFKEKERKSKLNPKRLGSSINRDKAISKNWMPNFGGIWNSGPRSSTRKEFLNKIKKDKKIHKIKI